MKFIESINRKIAEGFDVYYSIAWWFVVNKKKQHEYIPKVLKYCNYERAADAIYSISLEIGLEKTVKILKFLIEDNFWKKLLTYATPQQLLTKQENLYRYEKAYYGFVKSDTKINVDKEENINLNELR